MDSRASTWTRAETPSLQCGRCGGTIAVGDPVYVLSLPGLRQRTLYRCATCAGSPPPADLPPLERGARGVKGWTPLAKIEFKNPVGGDEPPAPRCARCDDTHWRRVDGGVVPCDCHTKLLTYADNVPVSFQAARFANFHQTPGNRVALQAAREFLDGPRTDLFFTGTTGTGKSRLAASILNEASDRGLRAGLFVYVPALIQLQLHGIADRDKAADAIALLDRCVWAEPLCLDDLAGCEAGSDFTRRTLLILYEQRINADRRTIWTSNLQLDDLGRFFNDDRLVSRIAGQVHSQVIEMTGADQRLSPAPAVRRSLRSVV